MMSEMFNNTLNYKQGADIDTNINTNKEQFENNKENQHKLFKEQIKQE